MKTTLTLKRLHKIREAMEQIKPIDQSDYYKAYYNEVTQRIEEQKLLIKIMSS